MKSSYVQEECPRFSESQLRLFGRGRGLLKLSRLPTGKLRYPKGEVERLWRQLKAAGSQ
jgi:hypothetical protein